MYTISSVAALLTHSLGQLIQLLQLHLLVHGLEMRTLTENYSPHIVAWRYITKNI